MYTAVALATTGAVGGISLAQAHARTKTAATADGPGSLMEDFSYPNGEQIEAPRHIKLISGDGHITLEDCTSPPSGTIGFIQVRTTASGIGIRCFLVHSNRGWLNLEVPAVYNIRGDGMISGADHDIEATVDTADADPRTIQVNPDTITPVGVGDPSDDRLTTLLQLRGHGLNKPHDLSFANLLGPSDQDQLEHRPQRAEGGLTATKSNAGSVRRLPGAATHQADLV